MLPGILGATLRAGLLDEALASKIFGDFGIKMALPGYSLIHAPAAQGRTADDNIKALAHWMLGHAAYSTLQRLRKTQLDKEQELHGERQDLVARIEEVSAADPSWKLSFIVQYWPRKTKGLWLVIICVYSLFLCSTKRHVIESSFEYASVLWLDGECVSLHGEQERQALDGAGAAAFEAMSQARLLDLDKKIIRYVHGSPLQSRGDNSNTKNNMYTGNRDCTEIQLLYSDPPPPPAQPR
jgi:hypothetical protein